MTVCTQLTQEAGHRCHSSLAGRTGRPRLCSPSHPSVSGSTAPTHAATGHSFSPRNVIFGLRESCTIRN